LTTCAHQRLLRQFQQTPLARFDAEQPHLLARPATDFDTRYYDIRHVGWDAYIDVRGNRYSVPAHCCGQQVTIRISLDDELTVYDLRGQEVARHRLTDRKDGWQAIEDHHTPLWQGVMPVQHRSLAVYEEVLQ